jgi:hypothetical protein
MQAPMQATRQARAALSSPAPSRRSERTALWQDSSMFQDSFFAPDNRLDSLGNSELASLSQSGHGSTEEKYGGNVTEDESVQSLPDTRH